MCRSSMFHISFFFHRLEGKKREGGWKFEEVVTMMCSHNIKPLSSFDTTSIWETTSLKVTAVSMVTGWMEAREEKRTKCSAC